MLKIRGILLKDFGPYKGEQSIKFEKDSGVYIFWGENMRGKSSLLNAFRYALFGKVLGRCHWRPRSAQLQRNKSAQAYKYLPNSCLIGGLPQQL
jgi:DNA repair exonuclease SbcCD ATPase subunit